MDHAIAIRRRVIEQTPRPVETADEIIDRNAASLAAKRIRAINTLGKRWVLHPGYDAKLCAHHNPAYKVSAVLTAWNHWRHYHKDQSK